MMRELTAEHRVELRLVAVAATHQEWRKCPYPDYEYFILTLNENTNEVLFQGDWATVEDVAHVAAATPVTMLALLNDLDAAEERERVLRGEIRNMQVAAERRNLELSALHQVWCDGGCEGGERHQDVTPEMVAFTK